ncbi:hypothetical protein H5410_030811 [Solanum commersonii]|uniref:Uncharacterized protein n=1 Tax=Solanum commersonii TaxID=4109 RepID=A0A9J5YGS0_SOLCO|nr:hypothetical protein H5410_030811 [Solanum commersonii]
MASSILVRPSYESSSATSSISSSVSTSNSGSACFSTLASSSMVAGGIFGTSGISTIPKIMDMSMDFS